MCRWSSSAVGSVMIAGVGTGAMTEVEVLACLSSLRRHQRAGQRSPHKSLLVLYVLGQLAATGSSAVAWSAAVEKLAELIRDHGPTTSPAGAHIVWYMREVFKGPALTSG